MSSASGPRALADDDAVRTHTQGVDDQIALRDDARAFDVYGARFETNHVILLHLQLGSILDCPRFALLRG